VNIPKCMSTQHPDNVTAPFFADDIELGGEDEIEEAYYAFSHLGCDEQMWDAEGKEVDGFVVKKLLTKYPEFFAQSVLGEAVFLTLRVPNPTVEKTEAKVLLETLESIPRSFDATRPFYERDVAPIFEVILPMASSARELDRVYRYYRGFVAGKGDMWLAEEDITLSDWVGQFRPERINVIPLYEDLEQMMAADAITREFLSDKDIEYQRVFLARSDPAMNYGLVGAVLMNKVALWRLHGLAEQIGVPIHPIVGVGSAPFRGGLAPNTVDRVIAEYPSVHTFTVQSAFKYDHPPKEVQNAVQRLLDRDPGLPQEVDQERCRDVIDRTAEAYGKQVVALAPLIQQVARFVPARRKRKLHVGLFGYARQVGAHRLPRAIGFTASLYSLGLPPEVLGLDALTDDDLAFVRSTYVHFDDDLRDALRALNPDTGLVPKEVLQALDRIGLDWKPDDEHGEFTGSIARAITDNERADVSPQMLRAAGLRRFLG
jgi:phosphoenolpyruvate carboxylase